MVYVLNLDLKNCGDHIVLVYCLNLCFCSSNYLYSTVIDLLIADYCRKQETKPSKREQFLRKKILLRVVHE